MVNINLVKQHYVGKVNWRKTASKVSLSKCHKIKTVFIWWGVTKCAQWWDERQKINYEANNDRNLTKLTTHCLDLYQNEVWQFFRPNLPPIMVKTALCIESGVVFLSGQKSNPKVRVYPEKFNIKNFPQTFSRGFYICWDYFIQFSQQFPMKNFSPSPSPSPPPLSGPFLQKWESWGKKLFKNGKN